ncbi:hypothetical protein A8F94_07450 [Bacillus sp. FJAT-27225]|uniref:pilus assembly PilX N-terminal domain-containing protein n=1 Tax=Bacillus sp. FJAT-27225 TaxID=1743144 RepID=UPI00080C2163|nr:pilus assembly PilX N-terminal domain-containing protein [Bacillus sp. FJAT-27225]OCA87682.1 hypothetical protein A8F94_07450 [Bacillus sp. FJAT-27225]
MKQLTRLLKNENGMALGIVLMIFVVVSILGLSMLGMAANNMKMGTGERDKQSAYYIAEAGITAKMAEIDSVIKRVYGRTTTLESFFTEIDTALNTNQAPFISTESIYKDFELSFGSQPEARVTIEKLKPDTIISYSNEYRITSVGTIGNRSRKVSKVIHVTWKPRKSFVNIPANTVLYGKEKVEIKNVPITGTIASFGTVTFNGSAVPPPIRRNVDLDIRLPDFPKFSIPASAGNFTGTSLSMNRDMAITNLTVGSSATLTINVGDYNRNLVVDKLTLEAYGKIKIVGKGKLSIFAKQVIVNTGSIINVDREMEKLYIFLEGGRINTLEGLIYGSMYYYKAPLTLELNAAKGVQGHFITDCKTLTLKGSAMVFPRMIYAPEASVTINASFSGSIIAKSIISNGADDQGTFQFVQINYENSPLFIDDGSGKTAVQDVIVSEPVREE